MSFNEKFKQFKISVVVYCCCLLFLLLFIVRVVTIDSIHDVIRFKVRLKKIFSRFLFRSTQGSSLIVKVLDC